jgi:ATP-dependent helicase/nuclease subunit B
MSLRFVIGRAGTGKTHHCFRAIVEAMKAEPLGAPIFWILPKQATFSAERELMCNSGLAGFSRCRVLSFDQLGRDVLEECRGGAAPEITPLGRQMLLGHLLRKLQPQLQYFTAVARQPGLAARLDATFAEFDRCGKDADTLRNLADALRTSGQDDLETSLLANKVADFYLLYRAYREVLGQERVDPHRRLEQVLACVHESRQFKNASVYVDGFLEFSEVERRMLTALAGAAPKMEIALLLDPRSKTIADVHHLPDAGSLFYRLEETYRRLVLGFVDAGVKIGPPLVLREVKRFASPSLAAIEKQLFSDPVKRAERAESIELIEAADRRGEVNAAARRIRDLLREGLRFRDIEILVRDLDQYHELINAAFREHNIRFFADRRRTAGHHPLLQFTRSLFQLARGNWPHEAVISLMKSGLANLSVEEADELENYVLLHRVRGSAWAAKDPWTYARTVRRDESDEVWTPEKNLAQRMDALRRRLVDQIVPFLDRVRQPTTVREIVSALFGLFNQLEIPQTLSRWIDQATADHQLEQRGEHAQVWAELVELFDQMVELLGEETVDLGDVVDILEAGLEQFDLALTPPTVDQVLVGQADRTRTTSAHTVFILGLGDGQFPQVPREDSVLSDSERRFLQERDLNVDADSERRLLDENLFGYIAFTRATHRLIATRAIADEANRPLAPSSFWQRLVDLFPDVKVTTEPRESDAPPEDIATPRQLVTALMRWARTPSDGTPGEDSGEGQVPWPQLYHWLATHDCCEDAIDVMRFKAWKALSYRNEATLSKDVASKLFASPLRASVTRVESFATCAFKHFAGHGLQLREREEADVTTMDLGNVYHQILERLVKECLHNREDWCKIEPSITQSMIRDFAQEVGKSLRGELMLSTARNQYLLRRIEKTLEQVVATQREVLKRGQFRPKYAELVFGENAQLPAYRVATPHGHEIVLSGKIDRVDVIENEAAFAVIDYKLSGRPLALGRVYHGLSLQLLTYLLVLQNAGEQLEGKKITPVAAFYSQLLRSLESVDHPEDGSKPSDPLFALKIKPRGIFDTGYIGAIDAELSGGKSEVVAAHIKADGEFGYRDTSDVATPEEFAALLKFVERKIAQLADEIIEGNISIRPYRIGRQSPCPYCEFRPVCRFDVSVNRYNPLPSMKRTAVLLEVLKGGENGR